MNTNIYLHLHIPKSGGTSLLKLLRDNHSVTRLSNKGGWRSFSVSDALDIQYIPGKQPCISAHMPYGLHTKFSVPCHYITFLRQPVDRLLSFYYYVKQKRGKSMWSKATKGMTLAQYIQSDLHDNEMVRYIAGLSDIGFGNKRKITQADLDLAISNLSQFAFVGTMETFTKSVTKLHKQTNWTAPLVIPHKLKSKNPGVTKLSPKLKRIANQCVKFDQMLYDYCVENLLEKDKKTQ